MVGSDGIRVDLSRHVVTLEKDDVHHTGTSLLATLSTFLPFISSSAHPDRYALGTLAFSLFLDPLRSSLS